VGIGGEALEGVGDVLDGRERARAQLHPELAKGGFHESILTRGATAHAEI
jgi:hypothetical protein